MNGLLYAVGGPKDKVMKIKEETRERRSVFIHIHALGFMKETRQGQTGCCPINCISTNIMYWNNKQTKQCAGGKKWGYIWLRGLRKQCLIERERGSYIFAVQGCNISIKRLIKN